MKARERANRAQFTSDLSSDTDYCGKRKRKTKIYSSSESEGEDDEMSCPKLPSLPKLPSSSSSQCEEPHQPNTLTGLFPSL